MGGRPWDIFGAGEDFVTNLLGVRHCLFSVLDGCEDASGVGVQKQCLSPCSLVGADKEPRRWRGHALD